MSEDAWRIEFGEDGRPGSGSARARIGDGQLAAAVEDFDRARGDFALVEFHIRRLASDGVSADEIAAHARMTMKDVMSVIATSPAPDV